MPAAAVESPSLPEIDGMSGMMVLMVTYESGLAIHAMCIKRPACSGAMDSGATMTEKTGRCSRFAT